MDPLAVSAPVQVAGLTHRYGDVAALDGVGFTVAAGAVAALIGPTGCGKSTVLRVLAGLLTPSAGTATVGGVSVVARPGRCGYMPQGDTLLPWRRALANATLGASVAGRGGGDRLRERAGRLFERFGLAGFEDAWPAELSGGMRQRVALLRTVLADQPVLLLDEPFGALDAITRLDLQGWLGELLLEERRTTIVVTHDVDEAVRVSDQVIVMSPRPGRVLTKVDVPGARPREPVELTDLDFSIVKRELLEALGQRARSKL